MRSALRSFTLSLIAVALILSTVLVVSAQNREKFVISAKAGGVNAVSGRAETRSAPSADWQLLNVTDDLSTGDFVRTSRDGLVEMLLNPGAYLRMAENSEFQLTNNSLEALEIKLIRGTAIIEATGSEDTELAINITTPHAKMVIVRRGLYRVNVLPGTATELIVRKGRVLLADTHTKIKSGNKVIFNNNTLSVAKLNGVDKKKDNFEDWSKERAGTLAQANQRISPRSLNSFLSMQDPWWYGFSASTSGLWFFNPSYRCFTFLPFSFGWGSPYGSSYSRAFYLGGYDCCGRSGWGGGRIVTNPPAGRSISRPGNGSGSPGAGGGARTNPSTPSRDPDSGRTTRKSEPTLEPGRPNR
ncbi:MAG TPA: FecR domain-containing protein [Pyrinomonadaceae bacterium]|nr:FecR domain-containing protein [Pyrinomonadaceae bacterium]